MTAHGITNKWCMRKYVLAVKHFPGSHTGLAIEQIIRSILEKWEIEEAKMHVFVTDSAKNMINVSLFGCFHKILYF
jgi:hypothetical protein